MLKGLNKGIKDSEDENEDENSLLGRVKRYCQSSEKQQANQKESQKIPEEPLRN